MRRRSPGVWIRNARGAGADRDASTLGSTDHSPTGSYSDGEALAVRIAGAEGLLADERDRGQSLNVRGTATAAAGLALVAVLKDTIGEAVARADTEGWAGHLLFLAAAAIVACTATALVVVVLGVLRPVAHWVTGDGELDHWTTDAGMAESEQAARFSLLAGTVESVKSRRALNEEKADWLDVTYRLQTGAVVAAVVMLATLSLMSGSADDKPAQPQPPTPRNPNPTPRRQPVMQVFHGSDDASPTPRRRPSMTRVRESDHGGGHE